MSENNNEIIIDGSIYYFDIEKICDFITRSNDKNTKEKEIVDSYQDNENGEGLSLSSKIIREITTPNESQYDTVKYDLVKTFIIQLITYNETVLTPLENNIDFPSPIINATYLPLGTRLVFNTLIEMGLLIKKEN